MHPQMFNQYNNTKKKREPKPDGPPRPTLLGHDVQLRDMQAHDSKLEQQLNSQQADITRLQSKVRSLEVTVNQLLSTLRKFK